MKQQCLHCRSIGGFQKRFVVDAIQRFEVAGLPGLWCPRCADRVTVYRDAEVSMRTSVDSDGLNPETAPIYTTKSQKPVKCCNCHTVLEEFKFVEKFGIEELPITEGDILGYLSRDEQAYCNHCGRIIGKFENVMLMIKCLNETVRGEWRPWSELKVETEKLADVR